MFNLIVNFLKDNNHNVNFNELKLQLLSHPSYPSLHSITGVLDHFNIENLALQVPVDLGTLEQLPESFISTTSGSSQYILVSNSPNKVELRHGDGKKETLSKKQFLQLWSGIIIVIDPPDKKIGKKVSDVGSVATWTVSSLFLIFLLLIFVTSNPTPFEYVHFSLSVVGLVISFLILKLDLGYQSKLADKFCNSNKLTSCDAVLNSNGATFLKFLKMSDLSIIYFSALILSWVLHLFLGEVYSSMVAIGFVAVLITFYTLYYQFKVVKKWCPLCLGITSVLWFQLLSVFVLTDASINLYNFDSIFILLFSFLATTSIWLFIKPLLEKQQELIKLKVEHYKFKKNFDLFYALYGKSDFVETNNINGKEILLGNKDAALQMLLVTNPSCFYCKAAHTDIMRLLEKHKDKVNLMIRFNVPKDADHPSHKTADKLLQIYHSDKSNIETALHEVYADKANLENWLAKSESIASKGSFEQLLHDEKEWCNKNGIHFTPALFINGKQYPKMYDRSDLQYFIEDLVELNEDSISMEKII